MKVQFHFQTSCMFLLKNIKKAIFIVGLSLLCSHQAFALRCQSADNGSFNFTENIGSIAVPQSLPDGTVIWRSENRTMNVTCWKDRGGAAENVYLYPNPDRVPLNPGIEYGIVLNGTDVNMSTIQVPLPIVVPVCNYTEDICKSNYPTNFTFSYNVYIKKKGVMSGNYNGWDFYSVFQLDGVNGQNGQENFRYNDQGLTGIRFLPCSANLSVTPNSITFDPVNSFNAVAGQPAAADKTFTATVTKDCPASFKLTAQYTSSSPLQDSYGLNLGNGLKLGLVNNSTGQPVDFSNVTPFADLTTAMSASIPFTTKLTYLRTTPTEGNYSTSITITVYYN